MSLAPNAWPMSTVAAMPKPNTNDIKRNMMKLALKVDASAFSPRKRPIQIEFTVPFSDWRIEEMSVGMAKTSRVLPIAPWVRSRPCIGLVAIRCPFEEVD